MNHPTVVSLARRPLLAALSSVVLLGAGCRSKPAAPPVVTVSPDTWATVNGHAITRDQVEKEFRRLREGAETLSAEEATLAKLGVLEDLIIEHVLLTRAASLNVSLPDSELDAAFNEAKKNISDEGFQKELAQRNLTAADMRDGLRRELLGRKLMEHEVASKITITDLTSGMDIRTQTRPTTSRRSSSRRPATRRSPTVRETMRRRRRRRRPKCRC